MSIALRVILIITSVITLVYVIRKLKKSQLQIVDVFFWLVFSLGILILGIFPSIAIYYADLIGIISPANFVFLFLIFLLILRVFLLNMRTSKLESRLSDLVQEIAIREMESDYIDKKNKS